VVPRDADACARQQLYEANKLTYHDSLLTPKWSRADGDYAFGQLTDVLDSYPSSHDVEHRIKVRGGVIAGIVGAGAGLAGFTLGYNATAPESNRWPTGTQTAMYAVAGGLVVAGLVTALLWSNPSDHLAETYNAELHENLTPAATTCAR
jgi:hypothetical protein